jgi:hypothetical protein
MNVKIGHEAVEFHFWEYINWILFAVQVCPRFSIPATTAQLLSQTLQN